MSTASLLLASVGPAPAPLVSAILVLLVATAALLLGGNMCVLSGSVLARRLGATDMAVAATVVAIGTSLPEVFVGVVAALDGHPEIALGNVFGSNIANIGLVVGFSAVLRPVSMASKQMLWLLLLYLLLLGLLAASFHIPTTESAITPVHGVLMLLILAAVIWWLYREKRDASAAENSNGQTEFLSRQVSRAARRLLSSSAANRVHQVVDPFHNIYVTSIYLLSGFVLLYLGGKGFVWSATIIAHVFQISEFIIAVVVIAVGTSLPELAVSAVAAFKDQGDVSIGNAVGSNLFNLLLVLGLASLVMPLHLDLADPDTGFTYALMVLMALALLPAALLFRKKRIGRLYGSMLLLGFALALVYWLQ